MSNKHLLLLLLAMAFFIFGVSTSVNAALITYSDRVSWETALGGIVESEDFTSAASNINFGGTSASFGSLTFASNKTPADDARIYALSDYLDLDGFSGHYADVTLPGLFSGFGFDYTQLDATGDLLNVLIDGSTVASLLNQLGDGGAFFGVIDDSGATIDDFRLTGTGGMYARIDVISWEGAPVPEPTTMLLLGTGLLGLAGVRRKRKK